MPRLDFVRSTRGAERASGAAWRSRLERHRSITVFMELQRGAYGDAGAFVQEITDAGFSLWCVEFDGSIRTVGTGEI